MSSQNCNPLSLGKTKLNREQLHQLRCRRSRWRVTQGIVRVASRSAGVFQRKGHCSRGFRYIGSRKASQDPTIRTRKLVRVERARVRKAAHGICEPGVVDIGQINATVAPFVPDAAVENKSHKLGLEE